MQYENLYILGQTHWGCRRTEMVCRFVGKNKEHELIYVIDLSKFLALTN